VAATLAVAAISTAGTAARSAEPVAPAAPAAAASVAAATASDAAKSAPAADVTDQGLFFETLDVNVVNVDVYVTDKTGKAVAGLTSADFEIFENNKPVKLTNFYAIESGVTKNDKGEVETEPSPVPGMPPVPITPEDQRLRLIVYIDNFNLRPFDRNRVFRQIREFLNRQVGPQDRVMLVTYDRELHLRQGFTSDSSLITSGLFDLEKVSAMATQADADRRDILRAIDDAKSALEVEGRVRQYAQSVESDLGFSIGALKETVGSLAGLPGRKALLYVSDGLELRPAEDLFYRLQEKFPDARVSLEAFNYDATRKFQELASAANANRVSFYTLDAAGLRVSSTISAENQTASASPIADSTYFQNLQAPLQLLAESTGGRAILNSNDPTKGLLKVAQDFDNYYSLGYTPSHSGDGRAYKIDVKLKGKKGLEVRHREGYRDKSVDAKMTDGTLATLHFGYEDNPLAITTEVQRIERRSDNYFNVTLDVRIPIGKLTLVPQPEVQEARARLFISAMDTDGRKSEVQQIPVYIRVPNAEVEGARGKYWSYTVTMVMRDGQQKIAIGVRDEVSTTASFVSRYVEVGGR
jgi:VWFA-related protein